MERWKPKIHIDPEETVICDLCQHKMGGIAHAEICKACVSEIHTVLAKALNDLQADRPRPTCAEQKLKFAIEKIEDLI